MVIKLLNHLFQPLDIKLGGFQPGTRCSIVQARISPLNVKLKVTKVLLDGQAFVARVCNSLSLEDETRKPKTRFEASLGYFLNRYHWMDGINVFRMMNK